MTGTDGTRLPATCLGRRTADANARDPLPVDRFRIQGGSFAELGLAAADAGASTLVTLAGGTMVLVQNAAFGTLTASVSEFA